MLPRTILWTRKNAGRERPAASLFVPRQGSKLKSGEPHVESWRTMDSKKQKNKINFRKINHEINARGWQGKVASTKEAHGNGAGNYSRVLPRGEVYVPRSRRKQTSIGKKKPCADRTSRRVHKTGEILVPTGFGGSNDIVNAGLGWTEKKTAAIPATQHGAASGLW
jgi:hypothetical protein